MTTTCRGIDVSAYQGTQDWASWKNQGVVFAFAKASEGQHTHDPKFATHIGGIKAAGLVPGGYHFAWPNQNVITEADNYISAVKAHAGKGFTHWLDLERYSGGRNYAGTSAAQILAWVKAWIGAVEKAFPGQRVGVYTSASDIAAGHVPDGVTLWYPAYPGTRVDTYAEAEAAARPKPSGRIPLIWQFTSDPAGPPHIDESIAYLSAADFRAWAGGATQEDNVTQDDIDKVAAAVVAKLLAGGGALEDNDLKRIWGADVIPAAQPPYANDDYFKADGKTPNNTSWSATYTQYTQTMGIRETLARVKTLQDAAGKVQIDDAQVTALAGELAADVGLAERIAEALAEKLAARLAE